METMCEPYANLMRTLCEPYANLMETLCEPYGNHMRTLCEPYANIEFIAIYSNLLLFIPIYFNLF